MTEFTPRVFRIQLLAAKMGSSTMHVTEMHNPISISLPPELFPTLRQTVQQCLSSQCTAKRCGYHLAFFTLHAAVIHSPITPGEGLYLATQGIAAYGVTLGLGHIAGYWIAQSPISLAPGQCLYLATRRPAAGGVSLAMNEKESLCR